MIQIAFVLALAQFRMPTAFHQSTHLHSDKLWDERQTHLKMTEHHSARLLQSAHPDPCNEQVGCRHSSVCPEPDGTMCNSNGSTGYADTSQLWYNATSGKFSGIMITNTCNDHERLYADGLFGGQAPSSCQAQTIPAPSITSTPSEIPVLGRAGMTLSGGVNVYSAFEAGFNDCAGDAKANMPCACDGASCSGGLDVKTCEEHLAFACTGPVNTDMFMDTCGGHASPYHIHTDPLCNYVPSSTGHSTIAGFGLDGYGIYGRMETADSRPCDLDACRGHVGPVPADLVHGIPEGTVVYHYHVGNETLIPGTWTLGCYGDPNHPVTEAECKAFTSECDDGDEIVISTASGNVTVDPYCPCFSPPRPEECNAV